MYSTSTEHFQELIDAALKSLPGEHVKQIKNVAILVQEEPEQAQLVDGHVPPGHTLLGLYQGTPLSRRQGMTHFMPDRITLFKGPLSRMVNDEIGLREQIRHTLWHEIAHYYGLDHDKIAELE